MPAVHPSMISEMDIGYRRINDDQGAIKARSRRGWAAAQESQGEKGSAALRAGIAACRPLAAPGFCRIR